MDMQGVEGVAVLSSTESPVIDVDIAMTSLTEHLESKELPELLSIAQEVGAEVAVQDKSGLITSIWRAL